jgi:hypothetical protein
MNIWRRKRRDDGKNGRTGRREDGIEEEEDKI